MNNQELYAKGFKKGWDKCREWICKEFDLNEELVLLYENQESEKTKINKKSKYGNIDNGVYDTIQRLLNVENYLKNKK